MENYMKLSLLAIGENECFARNAVAAFSLYLNPTLSELADIKTAVSEAVTNAIVHAYDKEGKGEIVIECRADDEMNTLHISVTDHGKGIEDVDKAVLPFYTTLENDERSGMGFTIMQTFMSDFSLKSSQGLGTVVEMSKKIGA